MVLGENPQTPYPNLKSVKTSVLKLNLMDTFKHNDETCLDLGLRWEINESDWLLSLDWTDKVL